MRAGVSVMETIYFAYIIAAISTIFLIYMTVKD